MRQLVVLLMGLFAAATALAQPTQWRDKNGRALPDTEFRRSLNGLGGMLIITEDKDWRKKWESGDGSQKDFRQVGTIARGTQVFVLAFFSNPKSDAGGRVDLLCDFDVAEPGGKNVMHKTDVICFQGVLKGKPHDVYLAAPVFNFLPEGSDPLGTYTVRMSFKDKLGNTTLPLQSRFTLE